MAFFHEPARQPALRVPPAVLGVILTLIVVHVARVLAPPERSLSIVYNYGFVPARYSHAYLSAHGINPGSLWDRAVPFVSYIFLHANATHLGVNCIWLLPFGAIVARRFGTLAFLALFLVCGVAGATLHLACNWGSAEPVIGASAAISGMMAAGFRIYLAAGATLSSPVSPWVLPQGVRPALAPLLSRPVLTWSVLWLALNAVAGITGLGSGPGVQLVAWQAHIGGYFAGLVLAGPLERWQTRSGRPF